MFPDEIVIYLEKEGNECKLTLVYRFHNNIDLEKAQEFHLNRIKHIIRRQIPPPVLKYRSGIVPDEKEVRIEIFGSRVDVLNFLWREMKQHAIDEMMKTKRKNLFYPWVF